MADGRAERFGAWVDNIVGVCIAAVRHVGSHVPLEHVVQAFAMPWPQPLRTQTMLEADREEDRCRVRVLVPDPRLTSAWTIAIEHLTARGVHPVTRRLLSAGGREAVALHRHPNGGFVFYDADGETVHGFDIVLPEARYGSRPARFDREMREARLCIPGEANAGAARFLQIAFGLELDPEVLAGPLPSFDLAIPPARPEEVTERTA